MNDSLAVIAAICSVMSITLMVFISYVINNRIDILHRRINNVVKMTGLPKYMIWQNYEESSLDKL